MLFNCGATESIFVAFTELTSPGVPPRASTEAVQLFIAPQVLFGSILSIDQPPSSLSEL